MTDRSRLDEIVEEESRAGCWYITDNPGPDTYGNTVKRIAERAFRHGVAQTKLGASVRDANAYGVSLVVPVFGDVQPAPAVEPKSAREYVMDAERLTREAWEAFHARCAHGRCWCKPDTRKGERRKGLEELCGCKIDGGPHFRARTPCGQWAPDRRTGKDRRQRKSG